VLQALGGYPVGWGWWFTWPKLWYTAPYTLGLQALGLEGLDLRLGFKV